MPVGFLVTITSNINIYASANELIKQYGEDALIHATIRVD